VRLIPIWLTENAHLHAQRVARAADLVKDAKIRGRNVHRHCLGQELLMQARIVVLKALKPSAT
jgi:hypothetical protein